MLFRFLFFIFPPIICFSNYIFQPISFGAVGNYRNDNSYWSFGQEEILDPNAIIEDINSLDIFSFGPVLKINQPNLIFLHTRFLYGFGFRSQAETQMRILAENDSDQIFERVFGSFNYKLSSQVSDFSLSGGFPFTWGPFSIIPNIGWGLISKSYKRNNIQPHQFNNQNSTNGTIATFNPTNHFKNSFYAPFIGVIFQITPIAGGRLELAADYSFHYGRFKTNSGYSFFTDVLESTPFRQTIRRVKQTISLKKGALSHQFSLQGIIGLHKYVSMLLSFQYRYWKATSTNSRQTLKGMQSLSVTPGQFITSDINETVERPFHEMKAQSFGGAINISVQI